MLSRCEASFDLCHRPLRMWVLAGSFAFPKPLFELNPATIDPICAAQNDSAPRGSVYPIFPPCGTILRRDRIVLICNGIILSKSGTILRRPHPVPTDSGISLRRRGMVLIRAPAIPA
jgi:hypothetical protein